MGVSAPAKVLSQTEGIAPFHIWVEMKDYWTFLENQYQLSDLFHSKVWVATDDRRILLYAGADPENGSEVGRIMLPAAPLCQVSGRIVKQHISIINQILLAAIPLCQVTLIPNVSEFPQFDPNVTLLSQVHHCGKVFVGLVNGQIQVFRRDHTVNWDLNRLVSNTAWVV